MPTGLPARSTWERTIATASERVRAALNGDDLEDLEGQSFRPWEGGEQRMGSKPLLTLIAADGRKYILKQGEPALLAAEQLAFELRKLAGRPAVPARILTVGVEGLGRIDGLVKPFIDFDVSRELEPDTRQWSELQRSVILLEHPWEWFLDNLDTNTSQYALFGDDSFPLNIDWDRSMASEARSELSRFAKYKPTLPNARTFLYADYVEGRVDLPFSLLRREAKLIRRLPLTAVKRALDAYALVRYEDTIAANAFVRRVLARQSAIEHEFQRLVRSLLRERLRLTARKQTLGNLARNLYAFVWNDLQLVLDGILRGPVGTACRWMLKRFRAMSWSTSRGLDKRLAPSGRDN